MEKKNKKDRNEKNRLVIEFFRAICNIIVIFVVVYILVIIAKTANFTVNLSKIDTIKDLATNSELVSKVTTINGFSNNLVIKSLDFFSSKLVFTLCMVIIPLLLKMVYLSSIAYILFTLKKFCVNYIKHLKGKKKIFSDENYDLVTNILIGNRIMFISNFLLIKSDLVDELFYLVLFIVIEVFLRLVLYMIDYSKKIETKKKD